MARRKGVTKAQIAEAFAVKRTKPKRRRKPMTAEQKAAAAERLKKARAARAPAKKQTYHPVCYDEKLRFKPLQDILIWQKYAKEQAADYKKRMRAKGLANKDLQHASDRYHWWQGYVTDINWYLRHGDWISNTWGKEQQMKTKWSHEV